MHYLSKHLYLIVIIISCLLFSSSVVLSQSGKAKSLTLGNKWIYYTYEYYGNTSWYQKVVGDTMIDQKAYSILMDSRTDGLRLFERADSIKIYWYSITSLQEIVEFDFDTTGLSIKVITIDTIDYWGKSRKRIQIGYFDGPGWSNLCYIEGIGCSNHDFQWQQHNSYNDVLVGGYIDGISYGDATVGIKDISQVLPYNYKLFQNHPNPFNPTTTISFSIPRRSFVFLTICDILGKEVAVLISKELDAGIHSINWDASRLSSGVYICKMTSKNYYVTKKLLLLK